MMATPATSKVVLIDGRTILLTRQQAKFLSAFRACGVISHAAHAAKVSRSVHFDGMRSSEDYRLAFADAQEEANDALEAEARRRGLEGVQNIKFAKSGDPIIDPRKLDPETGEVKPEWKDDPWYYERAFSDSLLQRLLSAKRPEQFNDKKIQHIHELRVRVAFETVTKVLNVLMESPSIEVALPKVRDVYEAFEEQWNNPTSRGALEDE